MPEKIGFVGVGRMGSNMARRLKDCGYTISAVYDARGKVAREVASELGAEPCKNVARVTELSDVIITVVSDDAAMDKIFAEKGASLLKNARGKIFINCATVSPDIHRTVEMRAHAVGAESLEASMASSITQAREGTLYLMLGGEESNPVGLRIESYEQLLNLKGGLPIPKNILPKPVKWRIRFLKPIPFTDYGPKDADDTDRVHAIAEAVRTRVQRELRKMKVERGHPYL